MLPSEPRQPDELKPCSDWQAADTGPTTEFDAQYQSDQSEFESQSQNTVVISQHGYSEC